MRKSQLSHQFYFSLKPIKNWLDSLEISNSLIAKLVCKMIPASCPFERDIKIWGYHLFYIPPLCKLNPFYEQLVFLRFRCLSYLTNVCHENISQYI